MAPVALLPLALAVSAACGGGDSGVPDDERVQQISGVADLATNAYSAAGHEGLYDYLAREVFAACAEEALANALAAEPIPDGFRRVSDVQFDGPRARANVTQVFGEEERQVEWRFVLEDETSWRLTHVPGLERCAD